MKVILLRDIARLGRKYEVKEVPAGHAQNFLIPRGFAEPATAQNLKRVTERAEHAAASREATAAELDALAETLVLEPLRIRAEANAQGHLFRGLRAQDITAALAARGFTLSPESVKLERPIKSTGEHAVTLTAGEHEQTITVTVEGA